jgi:hypothetical protein
VDKDQVWEESKGKLPDKSVLPPIIRFAIPVLLLFLSIAIPTILISCGQKVDTTLFLHSLSGGQLKASHKNGFKT